MTSSFNVRNAITLTLGLYQGSGGVNKSVGAFQKSLNSEVVSWVDREQISKHPLIWEKSTIVRGSNIPVLKTLLYPDKRDAAKAEEIIRRKSLVSCHSFWRFHNLWLCRISKKYNIPYLFVPHGSLDPYVFKTDRLMKSAFLAFGGRRFIARANCVIFSTQREREKALKVCQPARSEVIYWPLSAESFEIIRDPAAGRNIRDSLGIERQARCLLYFGRLHSMKRPLETIDAVAAAGIRDLHLLMIGNEGDVSLAQCREQASKRGIANRVHVVGPIYGKEIISYFAASDAYISLSHRENFNYTAAECLAASLPVILSPGNDLACELTDVNCGWLLGDDKGDTIMSVLKDFHQSSAEILQQKGQAGGQWAAKKLKFDIFASRLQAVASDVMGGKRSGQK